MTPDVAAEPAALSARGIRVVVDGDRSGALRRRRPARGLEGFSLEVRPSEVVHLVGDPTSGNAEAIEVLCGHRTPDAGRLLLAGQDAIEPGRRSRALWAGVVVVGAPPAASSSRRTVQDVVAEDVRRREPQPVKSVQPGHRDRASEILDIVAVPLEVRARRERDVAREDLGRVWLARLLAQQPVVVVVPPRGDSALLDTWDDMVSPELAESVLARLRAEAGTAVIRAGETLPGALAAHERAVVLCGGFIVEVLGAGDLAHPLHPWTRARQSGRASALPRPDVADLGCPFRHECDRAQSRCADRMPELTRPLGASHPVACWFPEDPRAGRATAGFAPGGSVPPAPHPPEFGDEPTAHEFVEG